MHVDNPDGIPEEEVALYVARAEDMIAKGQLPADVDRILLEPYGDEIEIRYYRPDDTPFDKIARITGYLTGSTRTWNDAKKAELRDRTKHLSKENPTP